MATENHREKGNTEVELLMLLKTFSFIKDKSICDYTSQYTDEGAGPVKTDLTF